MRKTLKSSYSDDEERIVSVRTMNMGRSHSKFEAWEEGNEKIDNEALQDVIPANTARTFEKRPLFKNHMMVEFLKH